MTINIDPQNLPFIHIDLKLAGPEGPGWYISYPNKERLLSYLSTIEIARAVDSEIPSTETEVPRPFAMVVGSKDFITENVRAKLKFAEEAQDRINEYKKALTELDG